MQFNSYIFILLFFPLFLILYYTVGRISNLLRRIVLLCGSAIFYLYAGWKTAAILGVSILVNYGLVQLLSSRTIQKKLCLAAGVGLNVLFLLYFKYFNFFITNLNSLLHTGFSSRHILLPLGISFFTFQQIAYLVGVYRKEISLRGFLDYVLYILYFPKLLMGPITEPESLISQFHEETRWDPEIFRQGLIRFVLGLFKKMLLADTFAKAVIWGFGNVDAATAADWLLIMLAYTFEIYFDFSGYSDMALGISGMLGITLPLNFDSPYKALSIRDFWKRWHISLTKFLTKYVYIPLGGNKKGAARTYLNTMIVFLVSGIWHGDNWTFILWGLLHGALSVCDRILERFESRLMETVRWAVTFFSVNVLWLLFRADSIGQWKHILGRILRFQSTEISSGLMSVFIQPETDLILHLTHLNGVIRGLPMLLCFFGAFAICLIPENNCRKQFKPSVANLIICVVAALWCLVCLGSESIFVYLNF